MEQLLCLEDPAPLFLLLALTGSYLYHEKTETLQNAKLLTPRSKPLFPGLHKKAVLCEQGPDLPAAMLPLGLS